jgi:hypothetical protein
MNKKTKKYNTSKTKVTDEELTNLQNVVKAINKVQIDIGQLEIQKAQMIGAALKFRDKLSEDQSKLKDKYGNVNVNIHDGTIKPAEDGEVDKKD